MKKTIITASALSCALFCSAIYAQETKPTGLYLKGIYDHSLNSKRSNPSTYGAGIGYKFGALRVEGQYTYGKYSLAHKHNFNALGYLDLDNATIFSPYIGVGVEKNNYNFSLKNNNYLHTNNVAALGAIGTRVYFNENIALDVGYKKNLNSLKNLNNGTASLGLAVHF